MFYNRAMTSLSIATAEWRRVLVASVVVLAVANLPLAVGAWLAPAEFSGAQFNPLDTLSYFAKMRQGYRGEWLFTLAYTANVPASEGIWVYGYYLALGHLTRWLGLEASALPVVYHVARLGGGLFFLLAGYRFVAGFFETAPARLKVWLWWALSGGLGWLAVLAGEAVRPFLLEAVPADFWVAEAMAWLTLLSNAHFPLAWGCLLMALVWTTPALAGPRPRWQLMLLTALMVLVMAQAQVILLLPLGVVVSVWAAWRAVRHRAVTLAEVWPVALVGGLGAPWALYSLWAARTVPSISAWTAQNLTPSPGLVELVLWGGLPLVGVMLAVLNRPRWNDQTALLALWLVALLGLMYAPFDLQRRVSMALWTPLVALGAWGWRGLAPRLSARAWGWVQGGVFGLSTFTMLIIYLGTLAAMFSRAPQIFLAADEAAALRWLNGHAGRAVVVAAPETGAFIPAFSEAQVIYGHPFETLNAAAQTAALTAFYAAGDAAVLATPNVRYVFYGPREAALGPPPVLPGWRVAFAQGTVTIYEK